MRRDYIKDILFGVAVADALGVPAEFRSREQMKANPITDMVGYGSHNQPRGTWSDDASLTLCLADALCDGYDVDRIASNFVKWRYDNLWAARGEVFDIGIATQAAIDRIATGTKPVLAGGFGVSSNGNGSLMRILPLLIYIKDKPVEERYSVTKDVSSITHGHVRSAIACFYYLEFARALLTESDLIKIYKQVQSDVTNYLESTSINRDEIILFDRLLKKDVYELDIKEIRSTGYVLHTLEASIWCLMNTNSYTTAALSAVNLGDDTDTTAAVTGGLAALKYGYGSIPGQWLAVIARREDIAALADRLKDKYKDQ
ncbi:ADP-ribosylglycohydrolase family protein [Mucilaginibacter conchicola]|uniref:ADP-ribosylglycohydrolase family protein n=1 Tax=Mucilaginibacter conchicola TaxID=2303333 RepID=A0A372NZD1_9SPHI|nr:ADP-ribosylglycohydrolase family protein [Mucilaginibacter conchicola]RFZ95382.1 ADP-ribosylglycohydrolase family protein [Mucilaginibacter conchicola]